ncbi:MAG TPA: O-antigen ligase family protein [Thermoanaerobaculia bacterium]
MTVTSRSIADTESGSPARWCWERVAFPLLTAAGLIVLAIIIAPGRTDTFRLIKDLALRADGALAFVLVSAAIAWAGSGRIREMLREDRAAAMTLLAVLLWSTITTLVSTNRPLSVPSLVDVFSAAAVFIMVWYGARWIPKWVLVTLIFTAALNATLVMLQSFRIWQPLDLEATATAPHHANTALIGNPNDVGSYLALVALILFAVASVERRLLMVLYGAGALIATAGVVISQTRTAVLALTAGLLLVTLRRSRRAALIAIVLLAVAGAVAFSMRVRVVTRIADSIEMAAAGRWNDATSNRFTPIVAALEMFRERPLLGFGPKTFRYHHMEYSAVVERDTSHGARRPGTNFLDVHNDHVQLLAETGLPGYAIFLSALFFLCRNPSASGSEDSRRRIAAALGLPFAVTLAVLCLAQFPLHLAITRHLIVTIAALIVGWRRL